jgi:histidinol-phosphate aminotransferase
MRQLDVFAASPPPFAGRTDYRGISLYSPNREPCELDLSDNTNLWGAPPVALWSMQRALSADVTRYPAVYADKLREAIGGYLGVDTTWIVTGCGSDDVLDFTIRAFAEPGQVFAYPSPSFAMVETFARVNGLTPLPIPLTDELEPNVDGFLAVGASVIYLCSPNNPTANSFARGAVERIVAESTGVVILDEAYSEFAEWDCIDLLLRSERLIVTRTMSKAFGLAGVRVGYAVAPPHLAREIAKSRGPYKVSSIGEKAAITALTEDRAWVRERVLDVQDMRRRFTPALQERGLRPLPSQANFILVPCEGAESVSARMRQLGVAVRPFAALSGIGDAIRITLAPWPILEQCLAALDQALICG